jgi:Co/Zn/Cd efflux system component
MEVELHYPGEHMLALRARGARRRFATHAIHGDHDMARSGSTSVVVIALFGNLAIAACKFVAASLTGSAAMASEGVHSLADTANELLLL